MLTSTFFNPLKDSGLFFNSPAVSEIRTTIFFYNAFAIITEWRKIGEITPSHLKEKLFESSGSILT